MNFFGHAAVAVALGPRIDALRDPRFVLGSMLPDFASMLGARVADPTGLALAAGIRLHHRTDAVFHRLPWFKTEQNRAFAELLEAGVRRGTARAVAHIGVEILLDAGLAADARAVRGYRAGLALDRSELDGALVGDTLRLRRLLEVLGDRDIARDSQQPDIVTERLVRALQNRPRLRVEASQRPAVQAWASRRGTDIVRAAGCVLSDLVGELGAATSEPG